MPENLVISRHWGNPEIKITVDEEGIALAVSLDDFCRALAHELGVDPDAAVGAKDVVLRKIKEVSIQS